ncbi:YtxH domain-containing protein [Streptomyces calidiresistens]|uniref:YtxH domain-containing protein n=1 Tax=Streptomyces calidiresistens TaxID=1485586 RepID=A0A7W3XY05_9ACTN|nr:hypothetical protein [Streptomyces calidiresistens]MBB0231443.1 hypothetical protein [Streptomyces calidiresistens]
MRKLTFIAGAAVGYVLGARAGRQRYEQIAEAARRVQRNPTVRNGLDTAAQAGRQAASRTAGVIADRAGDRLPESVSDRLRSMRSREVPLDDDWGSSR